MKRSCSKQVDDMLLTCVLEPEAPDPNWGDLVNWVRNGPVVKRFMAEVWNKEHTAFCLIPEWRAVFPKSCPGLVSVDVHQNPQPCAIVGTVP